MGRKNTISKDYMSDNIKFADIFSYYLFNGKQRIKSENLIEKDITEISISSKSRDKFYAMEKYRDILKQCVLKSDGKYIYLLLGIENQSEIHYAMPVRNMVYDAMNYSEQISNTAREHKRNKDKMDTREFLSGITKEDKLIPVLTLVIYWGNECWDAPKSLYEMFSEMDLDILRFVNDYTLNLIVPGEIEDFSLFQSELGKVLEFINASDNIDKMKKILKENRQYYLHMDVDSARMIKEFGKTNIDIDRYESMEEINMCKAIDDMIFEGEQKGMEKGMEKGVQKKLVEQVCKKVKKNKSLEVIAEELEESVSDIQQIYDKVLEYAPEYDVNMICEKVTEYY